MYILNGSPLPLDTPFEAKGISYPSNWLRQSTRAQRAALEITWEPDPVPTHDQRFRWSEDLVKQFDDVQPEDEDGNPVGEVSKGLKSNWLDEQKRTCNLLLSATDWHIIRKAERDVAVPESVTTYRNSVLTACAAREAEINACTTTEELETLITVTGLTDWP
jgi:hypothetical protein|tara:strand:- start:1485 stop:1970 length:486 start_codon:yes stop_codon:yes gene_type:complete